MRKVIGFATLIASAILAYGQATTNYQLRIGSESEAPLEFPLTLPVDKAAPPPPTGDTAEEKVLEILDEASLLEDNPRRILTPFGAYDPRMPTATKFDWLILEVYTAAGARTKLADSEVDIIRFSLGSKKHEYNLRSRKAIGYIPIAEAAAELGAANDDVIRVDLLDADPNPDTFLRTTYFKYWSSIAERLVFLSSSVEYELSLQEEGKAMRQSLPLNPFDIKLGLPIGREESSYYLRAITTLPNGKKKLALLEHTKLTKVAFTARAETAFWLRENLKGEAEALIPVDTAFKEIGARTNDAIGVSVYEGDDVRTVRYFRFRRPIETYEAFNTDLGGFHFPVGLFSVKQAESGLAFISLPIGLAWGGKFHISEKGYLGASLMGNWQIFTSTDSVSDQQEFILTAIFFGARLDLNDYVSIGGGYGKSFASGKPDPGWMLVVGLGPELLKLLQK